MEEINLRDVLTILGAIGAFFGIWYKINQDVTKSIEDAKKSASEQTSKLKAEFDAMRTSTISRQEHDTDIQNVKQEIRTFRDEVRDDIRALNTNLSTRFDMMFQKILDMTKSGPHR